MDDRIKKNPKNELLEDIRKIVKEEIEKTYIPYSVPSIPRQSWPQRYPYPADVTPITPYWDNVTYSLRVTGHSSF